MTLASVANPSPPTSFSAKQRHRTFSNTNRRVLLSRSRPWRFCEGTSLPVNIMAMEDVSPTAQLSALGVARISHGPGPYIEAMNELKAKAVVMYG